MRRPNSPSRTGNRDVDRNFSSIKEWAEAIVAELEAPLTEIRLYDGDEYVTLSFSHSGHSLIASHGGVDKDITIW